MFNDHITSHISVVRVQFIRYTRRCFKYRISRYIDFCFTFRSTLSGNQDNAISTFHSVNSCSRSILQYRQCFYRSHIYTAHRTFHTIYQHQWITAVPRAGTADCNFRLFITRHTVVLCCDNTRQITGQSRAYICDTGCTLQYLTCGLSNSSYHTSFLLLTITHYYHFFQLLGVIFQYNTNNTFRVRFNFFRLHADERYHQNRIFFRDS